MSSTPLPFEPQPLPVARSRYWEAVWPLYNVEHVRYGEVKQSPGAMRRHVFDFKTGIRMIITREHAPLAEDEEERGPYLVVGAKVRDEHAQLNGSQVPVGEVVRYFMYMSRSSKETEPLHSSISENGVLRLIWEPPFKGQYAEDVPLEIIQAHERHYTFGVHGEEKTVDPKSFDPRLHCSVCPDPASKTSNRTEQT